MNVRSRFTARSVSPLPRSNRRDLGAYTATATATSTATTAAVQQSTLLHVRRTSAALKHTGLKNYKEPSPTSTMHHPFDFGANYRNSGATTRSADVAVPVVGDEPFDYCKIKNDPRPMSTGHLGRLAGARNNNSMHALKTTSGMGTTNVGSGMGVYSSNTHARRYSGTSAGMSSVAQQAPLRMTTSSIAWRGAPPTSPTKEREGTAVTVGSRNGSPQSVTSKSRMASSFRQRRMQLTQERKRKEEQMERTVQYRTRSGSLASWSAAAMGMDPDPGVDVTAAGTDTCTGAGTGSGMIHTALPSMSIDADTDKKTETKTTIGGKELVLPSHCPGGMGMEISITNHLQKEGSDTIVRRHNYNHHYGHGLPTQKLPIQAARKEIAAVGTATASCTTSDDEVSPADGSDTEYVDSDVETMTIDTVSSLNTFQSEDAFSTRSWMPSSKLKTTESSNGSKSKYNRKKNHSRSRGRREAGELARGGGGGQDTVHPPMYVSSKKVRLKKSSIDKELDAGTSTGTGSSADDSGAGSSSDFTAEGEKRDEVAPLPKSPVVTTPEVKRKLLDDSDTSIQNISDRSPFEKSVSLDTPSPRTKAHELDSTTLASNKSKSHTATENNYNYNSQDNDIPSLPVNVTRVQLKEGKSSSPRERVRPMSQSFQGKSDDLSAKALRRRRLQNYVSKNFLKDEADVPPLASVSTSVSEPSPKEEVANPNDKDDGDIHGKIIVTRSESEGVPSRSESFMSNPFDESVSGQTDACEEKLEEDLQDLADQRDKDFCFDAQEFRQTKPEEEAIDTKSVRSIRSSRSLYSLQSLKTCFTVAPTSREEMKRTINRKKHRVHLIHHALTCTHPHPTKSDDPNYIPCPEVKHCHALSVLVAHVQTCTFVGDRNGAICEVPGCQEYKKLWNHYRRCVLRTFTKPNNKRCKICSDVWRKYAFDLEQSFESIASERSEQKSTN